MSKFVFDCHKCDYKSDFYYTYEDARGDGRRHIEFHHLDQIQRNFKNYKGRCMNPYCSHTLHPFKDKVEGFCCPVCGWDHENWYIGVVASSCVKKL